MPEPVALGEYPGIRVEYHEKPHRHYLVNGEEAVSVTTALGIIHKPLDGYIERMTLAGAWKLEHDPAYVEPVDDHPKHCPHHRKYVPFFARKCKVPAEHCALSDPRLCRFYRDLKDRHLDSRAATNAAADRGVDVHQVWQDWNEHRKVPNPDLFPPNRRGYIHSMAQAIRILQPRAVETEQVVGSAIHMYAGRLDTVVVVESRAGLSMIDLKTSSSIWQNTYFPQLAGYEIARRECGLAPTIRQGILRLDASGEFNIDRDLKWSNAAPEDFLDILAAWKSQQKWSKW